MRLRLRQTRKSHQAPEIEEPGRYSTSVVSQYPDRPMLAASTNAQQTSFLLLMLPPELRRAIYREVWRQIGPVLHIESWGQWKVEETGDAPRFTHWPCITDFGTYDDRQEQLQELYPVELYNGEYIVDEAWEPRIVSPWYNHWRCHVALEESTGCARHTINDFSYIEPPPRTTRSPFLPLLLTCKLLYLECIEPIYRDNTFVFTDMEVIRHFFGRCRHNPRFQNPQDPFRKYAQEIQISTSVEIECLNVYRWRTCDCPEPQVQHWLCLEEMESLVNVRIWIDETTKLFRGHRHPSSWWISCGLTELRESGKLRSNFQGLGAMLSALSDDACQKITMTIPGEVGMSWLSVETRELTAEHTIELKAHVTSRPLAYFQPYYLWQIYCGQDRYV